MCVCTYVHVGIKTRNLLCVVVYCMLFLMSLKISFKLNCAPQWSNLDHLVGGMQASENWDVTAHGYWSSFVKIRQYCV